MVNYVLTHKYRGLWCRYRLLNNKLHKCNTFLSRHYWFAVSLKSIHNSYLSCRLFLDSWENPFKARAGRRQETRKAVSENWSDRKWNGERSSQSPSIPTKHVPGGREVKGEGGFFLDGEHRCVPWGVYRVAPAWPPESPLPPGVTHNTSGPDSP